MPDGYKGQDSLVEQVATGSADSLHCTRPPGGGLANQNRRCRGWPAVPAPPGGTSGRIPAPAQFARFLEAVCALPTTAAVAPQPTFVGSTRLQGWLGGALARVGAPLPSPGPAPPLMRIFLQVRPEPPYLQRAPARCPCGKAWRVELLFKQAAPAAPIGVEHIDGCAWLRRCGSLFNARVPLKTVPF